MHMAGPLSVVRFSDAQHMLDDVGPFLLAREAENNLALAILTSLVAGERFGDAPRTCALSPAVTRSSVPAFVPLLPARAHAHAVRRGGALGR